MTDSSPPDRTASGHSARLRVWSHGPVEVGGSSSYRWRIVDRQTRVAFLTTSLLGLGSGESLAVDIELGGDASLILTGQGPTSLLRTDEVCRYAFRADLAAGAHLTYLPWATIPFRGARADVATEVVLGSDASFVGWDILSAGRVQFGEVLAFDALRSAWTMTRGEPLIDERFELCRGARELAKAALGGATQLGTLYAAGPLGDVPPSSVIRDLTGGADIAVSRPRQDLLVVKARGSSSEQVETALWPVVQLVRKTLGQSTLAPPAVARRWLGARWARAAPLLEGVQQAV